jgi:hypothetical protein
MQTKKHHTGLIIVQVPMWYITDMSLHGIMSLSCRLKVAAVRVYQVSTAVVHIGVC